MTKYARIVESVAIEILVPPEGFNLADSVTAPVAELFTEVPDNVTVNSTIDSKGKWTIAEPAPEQPAPITYPVVTPATFRNLFTPAEERAIKKLVADEPGGDIAIWWSRIFDSNGLRDVDLNLASIQGALQGLVELGAIEQPRVAEILTGQVK